MELVWLDGWLEASAFWFLVERSIIGGPSCLCLVSLIPLVKMHDVTSHELAVKIGGSRAGLVNATLSNTVVLVIAISALRKCELQIVQSSLIGSLLGKLLLILGLCFFGGGLRFSEQVFDPTANQMHTSLLSISVTALLIPAAYHFVLSHNPDVIKPRQREAIMKMSHGVSIILIFVYLSYLLFQLVSHTHLYEDLQEKSHRLSLKVAPIFHLDKGKTRDDQQPNNFSGSVDREFEIANCSKNVRNTISASSSDENLFRQNAVPVWGTPYCKSQGQCGFSSASDIMLAEPRGVYPALRSGTVRLMDVHGNPIQRQADLTGRNDGSARSSTDLIEVSLHSQRKSFLKNPSPASNSGSETEMQRPAKLSWFMTIMSLLFVTLAVAFTADRLVESMNEISFVGKQWVALILLPAVSSIAECGNAIGGSVKDQLTFSISVTVGSSIQTALFVIPLMVTLAWGMGKPLALLFDPFESLVLYMSVQTMTHVMGDNKSNWMEGLILVSLYFAIAVSFWFYPGPSLPPSLGATCAVSL
ncbi:hypothetical protein D9758_003736 [Tetrapyrgos nigripes]|uniref:Sodium/calcium exchanger membrane region domain-containing protein n=1 Tax=Tetrapyrgos nigripes TaxID=182062 RepID=A0A8H5GLR7_9AGAR|nr:hypothetical protein D9758_003736 [Tetrapyrgos nigripes]